MSDLVSSTPPLYIIGLNVPEGVNPYVAMQGVLIGRMYPRVKGNYDVRIGFLLAILSYTFIIAAVYLYSIIRRTKAQARPLWIARWIERPQGKYLALNQFILCPISTMILSIVWIAYVTTLRSIWYLKQTPVTVYTWGAMIWIPFFIHIFTTTFAVLSGGNLSSKGRKPNTHLLSPFVANGLYIFLLPIILALLIGFGVWAGTSWHKFGSLWQEQFDSMGRAALTWTPGATIDADVQQRFSFYISIRSTFLKSFQYKQKVLLIVFVVSCAILLIINVVGGLVLLTTLRRVTKFHSESSGSTPISDSFGLSSKSPSTESSANSSTTYPKPYVPPISSSTPSTGTQQSTEGLHRLESDVTLFFLTVPPILLVAIALYVWASLSLQAIHTSGALTELATLGIIWVYSALFAAPVMTILTIKSRSDKSSILRIKLHKEKSTHVVHLQQVQSGDSEKDGYVESNARHSHGLLPKIKKGIPFHVETARAIC